MTVRILRGDCRELLKTLPDESVHCVVTSPPYWGLRDYGLPPVTWGGDPACQHEFQEYRYYTEQSAAKSDGSAEAFSEAGADNAARLKAARWRQDSSCTKCGAWLGQIGLEPTPQMFVEHLVEVFREVRRVLRDDGTLWLNLGDSYAGSWAGNSMRPTGGTQRPGHPGFQPLDERVPARSGVVPVGQKPKDLVGIPWRVAFALQADGWYLRQDIIWAKPNPMPESVRDRCTKAHEYLFLLAKSERYYFDADAIAEPAVADHGPGNRTHKGKTAYEGGDEHHRTAHGLVAYAERQRDIGVGVNARPRKGVPNEAGELIRNKRSVWEVTTQPFKEAHFATFPPALIEPCILAGCPAGGTVLDPFGGAGTTGLVADRHGRNAILIELNEKYADMAERRIKGDAPLFAEVV